MKLYQIRPFIRRNYATIMLTIIIVVIFVLLGYAVIDRERNEVFVEAQNEISQDQVDRLERIAEGNQALGEQGAKYSRCLAVIFVQYTNDPQPISLLDFDKCILSKTNKPVDKTSEERIIVEQLERATTTPPESRVQSQRQNPTTSTPPEDNSPQTEQPNEPQPSLLEQITKPVTELVEGVF